MSKFLFTLSIVWCLVFSINAQDLNLKFRRLTVDNGMPHTDALCVAQDDKGFIWLGTNGGLCRYDGYNLKKYVNRNGSLKQVYYNRIKDLSIGQNGQIWLAPENGLAVFDKKTEQFYNFNDFNQSITKICTDTEGVVYAAYSNQLAAFEWAKDKGLQKINLENYTNTSTIYAFQKDPVSKAIWAANTEGVLRITANGKNRVVKQIKIVDQNQKPYTPRSLFFSQNGQLILGVQNGYIVLDKAVWQSENAQFIGQYKQVSATAVNMTAEQNFNISYLAEGDNGSAWIATDKGVAELQNWQSGAIVQVLTSKTRSNLSSDQITNLFKDKGGCLWVTSINGGADILDLNIKKFYSFGRDERKPTQSMTDNHARALMEDDAGNLWIGTRTEGLNIVNMTTNEWRYLRHTDNSANSVSSNYIRSLNKDKQGRVWIGSVAGIDVYDGKQFFNINANSKLPNNLSGNNIFSIDVDVFGQIWAGSWDKGLNRIQYQSPQNYQVERILKGEKGLCGEKITFVYADPQRPEVFVATSEGLNHIMLDPSGTISKIYHYTGIEGNTKTLSSDYVWPIVRTDAKTLWVGTIGGGLNKITLLGEGKYEAKVYTKGFPSNDIENLLPDAQGNLWIGGKGLTMFNPEKNELVNFDANDGLQSNGFKIGSAWAGRGGRLYFGGKKGVTYFYPDSILRQQQQAVKTILTGLTVNNQTVTVGTEYEGRVVLETALDEQKTLTFNHLQKTFALQFSTLQFANPEKSRYRYQLVGFDKNWIETDVSIHTASYSNLDVGDYVFRFMSSSSDGVWADDSQIGEIKVRILPPWWGSLWANLVYLGIVCGLAYGAWSWIRMRRNLHIQRIEERKSEELHQLRLQFFTNISHELRTPLSLITAPVEKLLANPTLSEGKRFQHYDLIQRNATRLLNLVNELLEFRKVESGTRRLRATQTNFPAFVRSICSEFEEIAEKRDIRFEVNLPENLDNPVWLDRAVVEKVIVNLLSNAFKYTHPAGTITIDMPQNDEGHFANALKFGNDAPPSVSNLIWLRVADTGIGLAESELQKVFDRFYRVTEAEQDGQMGSGIGLAFVRSLMALHRGYISVYSEKDKGTEFYIGLQKGNAYLRPDEIMVADETVASAVAAKNGLDEDNQLSIQASLQDIETAHFNQEHKAIGKPRLLIVEDNAELRQFLAESFDEHYHITLAEDGKQGLIAVQEVLPDIIISDIMMPEMDGIEMCKAIRATTAISHIPIVLLTAKNAVQSRIEGAEAAADAYIAKPFSVRLLEASVKNLLETRTQLKERYTQSRLVEAHDVATNQRDRQFLQSMMQIIETNLEDSDFDVEKICRTMGISRTVLYDKVTAITGKSVGEFIRKMRLETAARILVTENLPINLVMDRVGIQSPSYFSKAFKKEFGKTPSQYLADFLAEQKPKEKMKM
jgi:signal transduction histidine kinase/DNA-binding response OmpR family regulator/ligand-binding sensor domain-containing protein